MSADLHAFIRPDHLRDYRDKPPYALLQATPSVLNIVNDSQVARLEVLGMRTVADLLAHAGALSDYSKLASVVESCELVYIVLCD
jgi:hypothetical protein